jgi:plasmid stabilization system protein ParE
MARLDNLTPEAAVDLRRELRRSRRLFGGDQTLRMQARLLDCFSRIADGTAVGHRHRYAGDASGTILCLTVAPLLIFYDIQTRDILRIVDGRRDLSSIFDQGA